MILLGVNIAPQQRLRYEDIYSSSDDNCDAHSDGSDNIPLDEYRNKLSSINTDSYVVVKLCGKKIVRHYVARVVSFDGFNEYTVTFMKKTASRAFMFPEREDISVVERSDIKKVLHQPVFNEKSDEFYFRDNLKCFEHLY